MTQQQNSQLQIESDSIGERSIPSTAYYGDQAQQAIEIFPISGIELKPTRLDKMSAM